MWNFSSISNEVGRVVKLAFIVSKETFWGKTRLNETVFSFSPCFDSEQKTLCLVVTPASSVSTGMFWKKTSFWTILYFFQFGWMISGRVENRNLRVQKNIFGDFLLKNQFFVLFLGLWAEILWVFSRNAFGTFFRIDILLSRRTNWADKYFMKNSDFTYWFRTLSKNPISRLAKVVSASLSKMTFTRPEKLFEENNFLKTFTKVSCFWIWAKNFWQDGQTAFTCPVE